MSFSGHGRAPTAIPALPRSPLSLVCPFCGAKVGRDCGSSSGGRLAVVHVARVKAAAKQDAAHARMMKSDAAQRSSSADQRSSAGEMQKSTAAMQKKNDKRREDFSQAAGRPIRRKTYF